MNRNWVRQTHRWIGLIFSLSILMSAGSGVLHSIMSRTQAPPPPARPTGNELDMSKITLPVADAITRLPEPGPVTTVNIRSIGNEPWYQVFLKSGGKPAYISATSGKVDPEQDERYAAEIASAFLGGANVRKSDYLTAFNREYIAIFRVLPVYRFDQDDELQTRVYVSTVTGSVTRHTDKKRQFEANTFSNFHKLSFIPNKDLRDLVLTVMTSGIVIAAIFGIILFFLTGRRRKPRP